MDQTQLQQKIAHYYSKLPPDVQTVFASMKWMDTLRDISNKYQLTTEQIETLATETTLVMLGIIHLDEYQKIIEAEITIPATSMISMIAEIDTLILKTIRPQLANTFTNNANDLVEEKYGGVTKLDERFSKLPQEVQVAISESDYQAKLYAIANKHKLSINHMGALDEVTTKVMIGIIHPDKFEAELQANISIPKEEIIEIVNEVNEEVLKNIREILKSHWGKESSTTQESDDEVPIPPYAMSTVNIPLASKVESKIYEDSGIEIVKEEEQTEKPSVDTIPLKPNANIITNTPVAPEINRPNSNISNSIIGDKLGGITKSETSTTDYSLPKINKDPSLSKPHDPYHEAIE